MQEPCPPVARCRAKSACRQDVEVGPCDAQILRWYYDRGTGACATFLYGGCGGNANNFLTAGECERACPPLPVCDQPKEVGPCDAAIPRWWYDSSRGTCVAFLYGGCGGNENNFESRAACEAACP